MRIGVTVIVVAATATLGVLAGVVRLAQGSREMDPLAVVRSVVKVRAEQCGGPDRSATGFVWGAREQVVTSMHVIAGCRRILVYYEDPGADRLATLTHVLRRADLALLRVTNPPTGTPLGTAVQAPEENEEVYAVGYYLNVPTANRKSLKLGFGGKRLRQILPPQVTAELERLGYPDVELEIVNLEGHLLPGMSGAPIVNRAGELVAIADGGLEAGAAGASWGIPVDYLPALPGSTDRMPGGGARVVSLFAVDFTSEAGIAVRCGDLSLQRLRTRPFNEIARSTDDPLGLSQLRNVLAWADRQFYVDIYQDLESGATVVAPNAISFQTTGPGGCVARAADGALEFHVRGSRIETPQSNQQLWMQEVQSRTIALEEQAFPDAFRWQPDFQWSYKAPVFRPDGLMVRRKAAGLFTAPNPMDLPNQYAFETLAARGPAAVGIVAKNLDYPRMSACLQNLHFWPCPARDVLQLWAQLVWSTHLATFPLN